MYSYVVLQKYSLNEKIRHLLIFFHVVWMLIDVSPHFLLRQE